MRKVVSPKCTHLLLSLRCMARIDFFKIPLEFKLFKTLKTTQYLTDLDQVSAKSFKF